MSFIGPILNGAQISFRLDHEKFDATIKEFVAAYRAGAEQAVKRVGFELLSRTILRTTRVKTGRMKNGWHLSFHVPSYWIPKDGNDPKPDPGDDQGVKILFVQNNVEYAPAHEFGTNKISPLLMLTTSVREMEGELARYLLEGIEPAWNGEVGGVTATGLTPEAQAAKEGFLQRFEGGSGKEGARRQRAEFRPKKGGGRGKKGR